MPAPLGNKFWELRATHGRSTLFASPELMWKAACEYFESVVLNPWVKYEQPKGRISIEADDVRDELEAEGMEFTDENIESKIRELMIGQLVAVPIGKPFTIHGLCNYIDCSIEYFRQFKQSEAAKNDKDFSRVIRKIEQVIYQQKFEGAAVGAYNANIIARDLGLRDAQEITGANGGPIENQLKVIHIVAQVPLALNEEDIDTIGNGQPKQLKFNEDGIQE